MQEVLKYVQNFHQIILQIIIKERGEHRRGKALKTRRMEKRKA